MKFNLTDYCNEKLWLTRSRDLPFYRRLPLTIARVIVLTIRRFLQNKCTIKASALTFYTIFSVVPVLALIFGISKGLGMEKLLDQFIAAEPTDGDMLFYLWGHGYEFDFPALKGLRNAYERMFDKVASHGEIIKCTNAEAFLSQKI